MGTKGPHVYFRHTGKGGERNMFFEYRQPLADTMQTTIIEPIAQIFVRRFPGLPIDGQADHSVWFAEPLLDIQIRRIREEIATIDQGLIPWIMPDRDDRDYFLGFPGGLREVQIMWRALAIVGFSVGSVEVRPNPAHRFMFTDAEVAEAVRQMSTWR